MSTVEGLKAMVETQIAELRAQIYDLRVAQTGLCGGVISGKQTPNESDLRLQCVEMALRASIPSTGVVDLAKKILAFVTDQQGKQVPDWANGSGPIPPYVSGLHPDPEKETPAAYGTPPGAR